MKDTLSTQNPAGGINRVDGRLKVTGAARYSAEHSMPSMTYGVLISSTITKGTIKGMDTHIAAQAPGVIAVVSHLNAPKIPGYQAKPDPNGGYTVGQPLRPFFDNQVYFNGQPIALVIADSLERAQHAATLVRIEYTEAPYQTNLEANLDKVTPPKKRPMDYSRGQAGAYRSAAVQVTPEYHTPIHVHNAMEPFAVTVYWEGDKVTVYTKAQAIKNSQHNTMNLFGLTEDKVQVYTQFMGGAFGSASGSWPHEVAAIIGAKMTGKPLKVVLTRPQMFFMVGYRSAAVQTLGIGASADGSLIGMTHNAIGETSTYEQFTERITGTTNFLYNCANVDTTYRMAYLDLSTPTWTRGPGETTGVFALESAMDELAWALKMDPIELRNKNYAETDQEANRPWSSKYLKECYEAGAKKFEWHKRSSRVGGMQQDGWLVGYGMSTGVYGANRMPASASARMQADGILLIRSAISDMGPGTATVMVKIASDAMGYPADKIRFELGDSSFPPAPGEFGSMTTASVGSAVHDACFTLKEKFQQLAGNGGSDQPDYIKLLQQHQLPYLEVLQQSQPDANFRKYSAHAYCAHFAEVHVHPALGTVRVTRVVTAVDGGKILNPVTARSQIIGGVIWGIGMALMEEGIIDHRYGRYINNSLADYHVPVNADVPQIDVLFIDKQDPVTNPMGSKGLGEIALVGFAAAIANAIYHATGKRIRTLPITPDKLV